MKEEYADLHVHTFYSDSTFSPNEVAEMASKKGLKAIAICDHDCVDGIAPTEEAARPYGIEVIPGVELTIEEDDAEIHILGYFINYKDQDLLKNLKRFQEGRVGRIYKMLELLKDKGIDIRPEEVFELAGDGSVGRPHVALAMLKAKKINYLQEAFNEYIGDGKPCYVGHLKFAPSEAIEMIKKSGGVPVLAHPMVGARDEFIPKLIKFGLRGIEVYHSDHNKSYEKKYLEIAKAENLVVTGGSDCHGLSKKTVLMGKVKVPYSLVLKLKEEADKIKAAQKHA